MIITYNCQYYDLVELVEPGTNKKYDIIAIFKIINKDIAADGMEFVDYFYFGGNYDKSYLADEALDILRRRESLDFEDLVTCDMCGVTLPSSRCRYDPAVGYICPLCEKTARSHNENSDY